MSSDSSSGGRLRRLAPALLAAGVPFLLYCLTLYPGVGDRHGTGDAIEYQFVGRILSIPHEPGYPQFVLLSHLWSYLPFPLTLATSINLLSAVFTLIAGLFLYASARKFSEDATASVLATWMVLLAPDVWLLSTQAEVYSLHLLWTSAVLWAALTWSRRRGTAALGMLFVFYALSFGNHLSMITLLPALGLLVLAGDWRVVRRWQNWVLAGLAIAAGLAQYSLLIWRSYNPHPALLPRFPLQANLAELWYYVTGQRFVDRHLFKDGLAGWFSNLSDGVWHTIHQLTLPFTALCLVGLIYGLRRQRLDTLFLAVAAAGVMAFAAAYGIKDSLLYAMPAWFCLGILGAVGVHHLLDWGPRWRRVIVSVSLLAIAALAGWRGLALQVDSNPSELDMVIATAEPGTGILVASKPRRARLLRLYYQYGEAREKSHQLDFLSVDQVLQTGLEDAHDQILYFRDPRTARRLSHALVDFRPLPAESDIDPVFTTAMAEPLRRLVVRPLWNDGLAVTIRQHSVDLLGEQTLHLFLLSPKHGRSKGYRTFDLGDSAWKTSLRQALAVARSGDSLLLVSPRLAAPSHRDLAEILADQGLDWMAEPPPQHHTVAWWIVGGGPSSVRLIRDLADEYVLEIESPSEVQSGDQS